MAGERSVLGHLLDTVDDVPTTRMRGRVRDVTGLIIKAAIPRGAVGDLVTVEARDGVRLAEVVGFAGEEALLMPYGSVDGIGPDSAVDPTSQRFRIVASDALLGRVLDGLGEPIDGGGPLEGTSWDVQRRAPRPLERRRIDRPLATGVRAIDALTTLGEGQRIGLFAGAGVGKSTLLGQITRAADVDVTVVCLVGERGREVRDFVDDVLGPEGLARSVVVCATSDEPAMVRLQSAWVATAIAEWFRDRGQRVLLLVDSITRFARAQREVGLAAGEPAVRRGFPPSAFGLLPRLIERAGMAQRGSITAIYTVLVAGDDMSEPVADEVQGLLDGHIVLSRARAQRNRWPAVDVLPSLSRVMDGVVDADHRDAASRFRDLLAAYESRRDLIELGAYEYGTDRRTDAAIDMIEELEGFLDQLPDERAPYEDTIDQLRSLCG